MAEDRKAVNREASLFYFVLAASLRSFVPLPCNYPGNDNEIVEQRNAAQIVC